MRGLPPRQSAVDGDVLQLDSTAASGLSWVTPSGGGGGGGTPSSTVVSETSFGSSPAVGVATTYARGDHTHGTPAAPTAASVGADAAGTAAAAVAAHEAAADPHPQYMLESAAPVYYVVATDTANSTTTPADLTNLSWTPLANKTYLVEVWLPYYTAAATTGMQWQIYDASGSTWSGMAVMSPNSATTQALSLGPTTAGNPALGTGTKAGASPQMLAYGYAVLRSSASPSGTVRVRFNSEVATSAVTVRAGACCRVTVIA